MEHLYKAAVFDLDGTLMDTSEGVLSAVKYTIRKFGFTEPAEDELKSFIGPPIQDSFASHFGLSGSVLQEIAGVFRERYKNADLIKAVPYPGIFDTLSTLRKNGIYPMIATYKREDYAIELLRHYGFDRYTDIMYGADHENRLKKKDIILKAIKAGGITKSDRAVMIGDSLSDAIGAQEAGLDFIGVTYGFGFKSKEDIFRCTTANKAESPKAADSCMELTKIILEA